jgi:hypothetical protein
VKSCRAGLIGPTIKPSHARSNRSCHAWHDGPEARLEHSPHAHAEPTSSCFRLAHLASICCIEQQIPDNSRVQERDNNNDQKRTKKNMTSQNNRTAILASLSLSSSIFTKFASSATCAPGSCCSQRPIGRRPS